MVQITPLFYAIPVLSRFTSPDSTSNGLAVRQTIDPSSLPPACQSSCQVVNTMANCGGSLSCICANTIGNQLQQCMNCLVSSDPAVQSEAQTSISGWDQTCGGNLSLGSGSGSGSTTGGTTGGTAGGTNGGSTGGTTGGTIPATTTGTSSGGGAPNPLGVPAGGAVGLKTGSMTVCIVAALAGAFMSL